MTYQQGLSRCLENIVIINSERGPFIANILPDLELVHHGQCFPLYWYEEEQVGTSLFDGNDYVAPRRTDVTIRQRCDPYREDLFSPRRYYG